MQSYCEWKQKRPHVAIIMDGNGRWAQARGLPRLSGHRAGVQALRRIVEVASQHGVGTLTVYAFSADNWKRPQDEVSGLMALFSAYLQHEVAAFVRANVRLQIMGRRDRLPPASVRLASRAEVLTSGSTGLTLRIAVDYSAREAIAGAASACPGEVTRDSLARRLAGEGAAAGDVDFLIRTGGEQRLSDFLLWECAYAELLFSKVMWPDFTPDDFVAALAEFHRRDRRFGAIGTPQDPAALIELPVSLHAAGGGR